MADDLMKDTPLVKYEVAVAWYELILNREKLYLHLTELQGDVNGKSLIQL